MRAAHLQYVVELLRLDRQGGRERARSDHEIAVPEQQREPGRGREHVVRRLRHVDVIVGMHEAVFAARPAEEFGGTVRDHLVDVHVVRRAGAGLVDVDDELIA